MKWYDRVMLIIVFFMLLHGIIRQELNTTSAKLNSANNRLMIDLQNTRIEQNRELIVEIMALHESMKTKIKELEDAIQDLKKK